MQALQELRCQNVLATPTERPTLAFDDIFMLPLVELSLRGDVRRNQRTRFVEIDGRRATRIFDVHSQSLRRLPASSRSTSRSNALSCSRTPRVWRSSVIECPVRRSV